MLVLAQRTSLAAIGVVLCGLLSIGCPEDLASSGGPPPVPAGGSGGNGGGGAGGTAGMGGSGGTAGMGGTGGGTAQVLEDCTNGVTDDDDDLVDCQDVSDCACAPNCIDLFLAAVASGACVSPTPPNLLNNPGFEEDPGDPANWTDGWGFPEVVGPWGGDLAAVVGTVSVVDPLEGIAMMQFTSTDSDSMPTRSSSSERAQLIVANSYLGRRLCGVASFARVTGDDYTDSDFAVVTAWYDGSPGDFDAFTSSITTECFRSSRCGNGPLPIESMDAGSWMRASSTTVLPAAPPPMTGDTTALVMVRAQENVCNDGSMSGDPDFCLEQGETELDGHFVDDVGLFLVPDPPTQDCIDAMAPPG